MDVTDKCQQRKKEVKQVQETPNEEKQNGEHEIQADKKWGKTMRRTYNWLFSVGDHMTGVGSEQNMKWNFFLVLWRAHALHSVGSKMR